MQTYPAVSISAAGAVRIVEIFVGYGIPLAVSTVYIYSLTAVSFGWFTYTLESADICAKLIIIVVFECARGGLDVTAVFIAELVGKSIFRSHPYIVPACNPFVPARYKNKIGVAFNGIIPLLLEIEPVQHGIFG